MVNDSSFKKIFKYKKYKDCFDVESLECNCAFWGAAVSVLFLYIMFKNSGIEQINTLLVSLTKDIAISLVGFLGFTVAGLAILTGAISQKVIKKVSARNKKDNLEKILLSFYLLGFVISVVIVELIWAFIFATSNLIINLPLILFISFFNAYFFIFILFYSVKLVGNCLEIFFIVNDSDIEIKENNMVLKNIYNSYRITALECVCLSKLDEDDLEKYRKIIEEQIHDENLFVKELNNMLDEHFKKTNDK